MASRSTSSVCDAIQRIIQRYIHGIGMMKEQAMAATIARNAPLTVKANLRMMRFADEMGVVAAEQVADEIFREVYLSDDAREGPLAFKEKREPVWTGR